MFVMYGHGKLDLKFVHGSAENGRWKQQDQAEKCTHQRQKLRRIIVKQKEYNFYRNDVIAELRDDSLQN